MDKTIEKKKGIQRKHIPYILGGAGLLVLLYFTIFGNHASKFKIEKEKLTIATVTEAEFNDFVRINGQVQPINTIFLSAIEGGMVQNKVVEEGTMIRQGDVIVQLTNPMLNLNILESEAQLAEKQNWLRNTQVTMEQERLRLKQDLLQLDLDVTRKRRKMEQQEKLYNENLSAKEDYLQAKEDYQFALKSKELVYEKQRQDSVYRGLQVSQMEESLQNMRRNMVLIRQRIDNLNIKAPADGQLGLLEVEIGQSVTPGSRVGQINVLSDFKIEALIDEHYIDRVKADLTAQFERQDKNFALRVRKVYPEVRDKQFRTEFVFVGERPDNIRAGQTYYINLQLGQPTRATMVQRGAFFQTTGGQWIFVVSADGKKAVKRKITIARQNPSYYEITSGLHAGEQVITSGYENFGDVDELVLN